MKESYDKNPENWKVIAGRTPNSYNDMFFCQMDKNEDIFNVWQIKTELISPINVIGVGAKIKNVDEEIAKKIMEEGQPAYLFGLFVPQDNGGIAATGPLNYSNNTIKTVKDKIKENEPDLEKSLKKKLKELIDKEFPGRFDMFG